MARTKRTQMLHRKPELQTGGGVGKMWAFTNQAGLTLGPVASQEVLDSVFSELD